MQDVIDTVDNHVEALTPSGELGDFGLLSQRWASHALATYRDELLTKALAIAKALSEFDNELLNRNEAAN